MEQKLNVVTFFIIKSGLSAEIGPKKIVVLYSDSRLAWFREGSTVAEESILLSDAPELLAAGQWVWRIPRPPSLPTGACPKLAIACGTSVRERAHWFLCHSQDDLI